MVKTLGLRHMRMAVMIIQKVMHAVIQMVLLYMSMEPHKLINYVYENGKRHAYISADLMGDDCVGYFGYWSPDSI